MIGLMMILNNMDIKVQDKVKILVERRKPSRRIVREWIPDCTIISSPRVSPYGYTYYWCHIDKCT